VRLSAGQLCQVAVGHHFTCLQATTQLEFRGLKCNDILKTAKEVVTRKFRPKRKEEKTRQWIKLNNELFNQI
jgi:hypothetical protein